MTERRELAETFWTRDRPWGFSDNWAPGLRRPAPSALGKGRRAPEKGQGPKGCSGAESEFPKQADGYSLGGGWEGAEPERRKEL